jgi:branched-chain amino acid transport system substrate-binding protein
VFGGPEFNKDTRTPLSSPTAIGYGEIAPASKAFFAHVNSHGGVDGRKINYTYLDDSYDAAKAVADEKKLVFTDHVFAIFNAFGVTTQDAVVGFLNAQAVPDLFVGSSCACWNQPGRHPDTFGFGTNHTVEGRLMGHYVARTFPPRRSRTSGKTTNAAGNPCGSWIRRSRAPGW